MFTKLEFTKEIALKAGEILRQGYSQNFTIQSKKGRELVTEYDFASETLLRREIGIKYPEHSILAEEEGGKIAEQGFTWVIDPLDGTNNFAHHLPFFCVSIGLLKNGKPVLGVVYEPLRNEMFASDGGISWLNNKEIHVEKRELLEDSIFATGFPYDIKSGKKTNLDNFNRFCTMSRGIRRFGSAALDLCYVAAGRFDGYWEACLKPWDIAAGYVIVKAAGGVCTDYLGKKWTPATDEIVCANPTIHKKMLTIINS